ncbi:MAG: guanylate kinase [Acidobacteria bacterium OLB17]|nr:MAG: guanylate kinase [Acidobacteria bacterium OLB17]MCZ2389517.1 guanylate kinase [Acidobacteriota bacterium]
MIGNLIIISSPSGGGKGTLIREVLRTTPDITFSVSYTTREMRAGEKDGREYFFVDVERFKDLIAAGEFLEYAEVHGNYYGTSRSQVNDLTSSGKDVLLEVDVQGAKNLLASVPDAVSIFVLPPSFPTLETRLRLRATESSGDLQVRLRNSFSEILEYDKFRFAVVNDDLETAVEEMRTIIRSERHRTNRQNTAFKAILDSFDAAKHRFEKEPN